MFRKVAFGALMLAAVGVLATSVLAGPVRLRPAPVPKGDPVAPRPRPAVSGKGRVVPVRSIRLIKQKGWYLGVDDSGSSNGNTQGNTNGNTQGNTTNGNGTNGNGANGTNGNGTNGNGTNGNGTNGNGLLGRFTVTHE
jgi:hypothetical protein